MRTFTDRLLLDPVDEAEARRIRDRAPGPDDRWAPDYPFDGDLAGIGAFLRASEQHGEQRPYGYYRISLRSTGLAIGGIGFKGRPEQGVVEIGYGLVPSARGRGCATEAVLAVLDIATSLGVRTVRADTDPGNRASQRVLQKAGFRPTRQDETCWFEIDLGARAPVDPVGPHRAQEGSR